MKFCEECGAQLEDDAVFCENCGTQVDEAETVDTADTTDAADTTDTADTADAAAGGIMTPGQGSPVAVNDVQTGSQTDDASKGYGTKKNKKKHILFFIIPFAIIIFIVCVFAVLFAVGVIKPGDNSGFLGQIAATQTPTAAPTELPTQEPTQEPTAVPTQAPTEPPTAAPTEEPTPKPTKKPKKKPTPKPAADGIFKVGEYSLTNQAGDKRATVNITSVDDISFDYSIVTMTYNDYTGNYNLSDTFSGTAYIEDNITAASSSMSDWGYESYLSFYYTELGFCVEILIYADDDVIESYSEYTY